MLVSLEGDRAVRIAGNPDHEFTQGFLCNKVSRYIERVYHPDRLTQPLIRTGPKGSGQFEPVSWDHALGLIAQRFQEIIQGPHGPQAILPYSYCGTMGKIQGESLDRRFFHRLGASLLDRTICATAGGAGYLYTIGSKQGTDPLAVSESQYIINWGSNTAITNVHLWVRMLEAKKRGAKIVTIDPFRSVTAERSDWHIAPKPGTDAALALGMMSVIFRDGLEDQEYLEQYCLGVDELKKRVESEFTPQQAAEICGLPVEVIEQLAAEYANTSPAVIRMNYGLQRHFGGGMAVRTIACLPAVIGAWRHCSGGVLLSTSSDFPLNFGALQRPDLIPPGTRTVNMVKLAEALNGELEGPPVMGLYVYNSNPAAIAPDQNKVLAGLKRDDLFTVVHELFQTDTADYADVVLPATSQLEHFDLHVSYGHHWVQVNQPAIAPLSSARCNTEVFRNLAEKMGLEPELFQVDDEQLARTALWEGCENVPKQLTDISLDRLKSEGSIRLNVPRNHAPFENGGFPTPSGKCEFFSEQMQQAGLDPVPGYTEPLESAESSPALGQKFPLQLLSPPSPHFLRSSFVNIDSLRKRAREPELQIHADDAKCRGIEEGQRVQIQNDRGEFFAKARILETVRPGVVVAEGVWWNKMTDGTGNANLTTSTQLTDIGGGATFFDNLVEVLRA
jgi:anaerobic selenocysteine-containing dehydrogenase